MQVTAFSVAEFGLSACGSSLWRVPLTLTSVVSQLCSLPHSLYLYLRPYAYSTPHNLRQVLIHAPVPGFLGVLLLILLLGIQLLIFHQSLSDLICLLRVFGFLGFYVLDLFVLFFKFFL